MNCVHITACRLSCSPSALPPQAFQLNKASACTSTYLGTRLPKISLKLSSATPKYQRFTTICLFGGKGKPEDGNQASPWNALEKAMGNFKKDPSIEDVLKQQMQTQEYYDDGGSGGKRPGGGGGGGDGFGEAEDESLSGMWEEFLQVLLATLGFLFLYVYIIENEEITVISKDILKFIFTRRKSIRLTRLMNQWGQFFRMMREKQRYDKNWLEREILRTRTWYDSPEKYRYIGWALSRSDYDDDDDFF